MNDRMLHIVISWLCREMCMMSVECRRAWRVLLIKVVNSICVRGCLLESQRRENPRPPESAFFRKECIIMVKNIIPENEMDRSAA